MQPKEHHHLRCRRRSHRSRHFGPSAPFHPCLFALPRTMPKLANGELTAGLYTEVTGQRASSSEASVAAGVGVRCRGRAGRVAKKSVGITFLKRRLCSSTPPCTWRAALVELTGGGVERRQRAEAGLPPSHPMPLPHNAHLCSAVHAPTMHHICHSDTQILLPQSFTPHHQYTLQYISNIDTGYLFCVSATSLQGGYILLSNCLV